MKIPLPCCLPVLCFIVSLLAPSPLARADEPPTLRYDHAAARWTEALPVVSSRLGAMVFGGWLCRLLPHADVCPTSLFTRAPV